MKCGKRFIRQVLKECGRHGEFPLGQADCARLMSMDRKWTQFSNRLITSTNQDGFSMFHLVQIMRKMGFGFVDIDLFHD